MSTRVTDDMVSHWLIWARNFREIVNYSTGGRYDVERRRGTARRFRIRLTPGITANGGPFRPKEGIVDILGHAEKDVVPHELMLTAREALIFGYGCAVGRAAALAGDYPDWREEWPDAAKQAFVRRRDEARERDQADYDRAREERVAARERRAAEFRRRRQEEEGVVEELTGEVVDEVLELTEGDGSQEGSGT